MPAKLSSPIEIVTKQAVEVDSYKTVQIVVSLKGNPYITVKYDALNADGEVIGTSEAILSGSQVTDFIANNASFYADVKNQSYQIGKDTGVIPSDAGVI